MPGNSAGKLRVHPSLLIEHTGHRGSEGKRPALWACKRQVSSSQEPRVPDFCRTLSWRLPQRFLRGAGTVFLVHIQVPGGMSLHCRQLSP